MSDDAVWSLLFRLEAENSELRRVFDDTDRRLGRLEGSVNRSSRNVGAGLRQIRTGAGQVASGIDHLATRAALLAAGGLTAVIKTAIDFESAFAGVRKTVDASPAGIAAFREEIRGMARELPIAHEELARIAEAGGALGVGFDAATGKTNLASLKEFTRISALLGVTTDVSSDQAATSLGVLSNVLGLLEGDYSRFGSTLVDLGNKGASTESQILGIAERAGAGAKLIDLSAAATLGWSSAVANLGIEVEAGGTSLQTFFLKSLKMISEGGDELAVYAETAGMAKDEFAELFGRDSSQALTEFIRGLGDLEEAERLAVLKALGFNDVRISRALLGLSGDVDNLTDSLKIADQAWEANSALGAEAAKRFETTQSQLQMLANNAKDAAITVGDELLPIVNEFAKEGVAWLIAHRGEIKGFGEDLAAGIRGLGESLQSTDWSGLLSTLQGAASVARTAFDAFMKLPDPVKQILLAAIVANKVTGGAVGSIAGGLGNILAGALKVGFGLRGASPANPLWVQMAGGLPGVGGGPGSLVGAGGMGALLRTVLKGAGVLAAAEFAHEFGDEINRAGIDIHDALGLSDPPDWLSDFLQTPLFGGGTDGTPKGVSTESLKGVKEPAGISRLGDLLTDVNTTIDNLARITEVGLKDVGTTFQVGLQSGLDPIGDTATSILARAEDPKAPAVMREIQGHIAGLEEIQATYLANGDVKLAGKVQGNIDTLHRLIGTTDTSRTAITGALAAETGRVIGGIFNLGSVTERNLGRVDSSIDGVKSGVDSLHGTLKAKNWAPTVNVAIAAEVYASVGSGGSAVASAVLRGTTPVKLHEGTWNVPGTGLAMLHEGEMVVPSFDAEAFRRVVEGGGDDDDGGRHVHLHTSGLPDISDDAGLRRAVDRTAWFAEKRF